MAIDENIKLVQQKVDKRQEMCYHNDNERLTKNKCKSFVGGYTDYYNGFTVL